MDYIDYKSANIKASTMESLSQFKEAHKEMPFFIYIFFHIIPFLSAS